MSVQFINGVDAGVHCKWYRALDIGYLYRREGDGSLVPILDNRAYRTKGNGRVQFVGRGLIEFGETDDNYPGPGQSLNDSSRGNAFSVVTSDFSVGALNVLTNYDSSPVIVSIQKIDVIPNKTVAYTDADQLALSVITGPPSRGAPFLIGRPATFLASNNIGYLPPLIRFSDYVPPRSSTGFSTVGEVSGVTLRSFALNGNMMIVLAPGSTDAASVFGGESLAFVVSGNSQFSVRFSGRAYRIPGASSL